MLPYNKITKSNKQDIINSFYNEENLNKTFEEMSLECGVSKRAFSRVLRDEGINTKTKNRYTLNENYFEKIDTERKAYWLGLLHADGHYGNDKFNNISISLMEEDKYILLDFMKDIDFSGKLRKAKNSGGYYTENEQYVLNFSSKKMCSDIRKLYMRSGEDKTKKILPNIPEEFVRHFVRGFFDGDGSISISKNREQNRIRTRYVFSIIGEPSFLDELREFIPIKLIKGKCKTPYLEYAVCNANSRLKMLYDYLYCDATACLKRKFNKWNIIIGALDEKSSKTKQDEPNMGV